MSRNHSCFLTTVTASLLLVSCSVNLFAQQLLEKSKWVVNAGAHLVQINTDGVHINQPDLKELTYQGIVSTRLDLPKGRPWQIIFDLKFGQLRSAGSGICLFDGNNVVGWVGADGWYKKMGCFVGKDNEVAIPDANTEWHHFTFVSDGTTLTVKEDGTKIGSGMQSGTPDMIKIGDMFNPFRSPGEQPAKMPAGQQTELWVRDVSFSSSLVTPSNEAFVTPANAFLPVLPQPSVVSVQDSDNALYCVLGDTVHLTGTTSEQHRLSRRTFLIDGQPFSDAPTSPDDNDYNFSWKPTTPGSYHLDVKFTLANPFGMVTAKGVDVTVLPKAPLALPQFSKPIPASCPIAVQSVDTSVFHPARVEFFLNGQSVGNANQPPFQVTLPISQQLPGSYTVSYQAYDAQGARWNGEAETVTVPLRVKLTTPSAVTLASEKDQTHFTADIVPGLKIVRVDYSVDDQHVASTTTAPYDAPVNLSAFKSGPHSVKAEVVTEDGETFCNSPTTLTLTNQPDDARQAQLAKDEADKKATLAKQVADESAANAERERANKEIENNLSIFWPRPGFDEKVFRKQAAALAYYVPEKRYGQVGKVHGLAVFSMTHDGETVLETGVPLTVSASVRSGTGQTTFLAFSEEDAKVTAQQAAEYCKTKTAFYHWDWSKYDLTVGYLENDVKNGGPSAGAADALAMMSAILNTPVDTSIAITGAITLQGQVEPVGGLGLKVESAFADTNVHTVILPADSANDEDLIALYMTHPVLCFNRRVILARDMDEVMNQALIGWNTDSEVREEKLVQGGLRHFARGEDKQALVAFAAAKQITPENWTIDFWTAMVYAVEKQHNEDAMTASGE